MIMDNYVCALSALIISLRARLKACAGYIYNTQLQVECDIISKQIKALESEVIAWQKQKEHENDK